MLYHGQRAWAVVFALSLVLGAVVSIFGADDKRDALWYSYKTGPVERQKLLAQAQRRLKSVRHKAEQNKATEWPTDENFRWLTEHRTPGRLVVEKALKSHPRGASLKVLVLLTRHLEGRRLTRHLPDLAFRSRSMETRRLLFETMASVGGEKCRETLRKFLGASDHSADEQLLCSAAEGLAATKDKKYIPLLKKAYGLVHSEPARLRIAVALYKCGERDAGKQLLEHLRKTKDPEVLADALGLLAIRPVPNAIPVMEKFAVESPDPAIATLAFEALKSHTGFQQKRPDQQPTDKKEPEKFVAKDDLRPDEKTSRLKKQFGDLSKKARQKRVQRIVQWARAHPDAIVDKPSEEDPRKDNVVGSLH
ncbi:MAG: hypothetical protein KGZ25_10345 [Planctomycetes bacterium]|nr:hypothetical protein [Planctomycetota bacterium]